MSNHFSREPADSSCATLLWLIGKEEDVRKRELFLIDLLHKSSALRPNERNSVLAAGFSAFLPERSKAMSASRPTTQEPQPLIDIDVAIITLKKPELLAAKIAFGVSIDAARPRIEKAYHFYEGEFENRREMSEKYRFVLTVVGDDRNVPCSNCVRALLSVYRPKICVLVGMAAGDREKIGLGDVVVAEAVIDIAGGRAEVGGVIPRPDTFSISKAIRADLTNYDEGWASTFQTAVTTLRVLKDFPSISEPWIPKYKHGVILSGEQLIADGSLEALRRARHEQAIALDMESSGFAQACISEDVPWIIFRGISDFGDPESKDGAVPNDPARKNWQPYASLAAAWIARDFLSRRYRSDLF